MRRMLILLIGGLLALPVWSPATAGSSVRTSTKSYSQPTGVSVADTAHAYLQLGAVIPTFSARSGERSVSFEIKDDFGQPVRGHIHVDKDGDGELDAARDFCGSTPKPITITPQSQLEVWVMTGTCPNGTPAFATTGTITATFLK